MDSWVPTGIDSCMPEGRAAVAMRTRQSPGGGTAGWTLVSFEAELLQNRVCHGDELIGNGGGRSSVRRGPSMKRPHPGYEAVVSQRHGEAVRWGVPNRLP